MFVVSRERGCVIKGGERREKLTKLYRQLHAVKLARDEEENEGKGETKTHQPYHISALALYELW